MERLFKRRTTFLLALLPLPIQRLRQSRSRAGLTGTPAVFNSAASWPLLQPLRYSASNFSRNGSSRSSAVLRCFGGLRSSIWVRCLLALLSFRFGAFSGLSLLVFMQLKLQFLFLL